LNVNEASNQEIPPMVLPGFELMYNGKVTICANFTHGPTNTLSNYFLMYKSNKQMFND
jgi:hypothetical protein